MLWCTGVFLAEPTNEFRVGDGRTKLEVRVLVYGFTHGVSFTTQVNGNFQLWHVRVYQENTSDQPTQNPFKSWFYYI